MRLRRTVAEPVGRAPSSTTATLGTRQALRVRLLSYIVSSDTHNAIRTVIVQKDECAQSYYIKTSRNSDLKYPQASVQETAERYNSSVKNHRRCLRFSNFRAYKGSNCSQTAPYFTLKFQRPTAAEAPEPPSCNTRLVQFFRFVCRQKAIISGGASSFQGFRFK